MKKKSQKGDENDIEKMMMMGDVDTAVACQKMGAVHVVDILVDAAAVEEFGDVDGSVEVEDCMIGDVVWKGQLVVDVVVVTSFWTDPWPPLAAPHQLYEHKQATLNTDIHYFYTRLKKIF